MSRIPAAGRSVCRAVVSAESLERRALFSGIGVAAPHPGPARSPAAGEGDTFPLVVPVYESNPAAAVRLELDFDGDTVPAWGSFQPGVVPAYDRDGDSTTFSQYELDAIHEIFLRVAEKYSPFNVNVTTAVSGSLAAHEVFKIDIGGDGAWYGQLAGGVAYVGSFANGGATNTAFVFPDNVSGEGNVAEAVAHEAGHGFTLVHQSDWDGDTKTNEYSTNDFSTDYAPVMGTSYYADRGLWWHGRNANGVEQDDADGIAGPYNGFDYRPDEAGTLASPKALTIVDHAFTARGVITATANAFSGVDDKDYYSFTLAGRSTVHLNVATAAFGAMLNPQLMLIDSAGQTRASVNRNADTRTETGTFDLPAGTYRVRVGGADERTAHDGDNVGQYTLSGYIEPANVATGSIAGTVFKDLNADGKRGSGESGLAGVAVYLDADNDAVKDSGETATTTDASGNYLFTGLAAAEYKVRQVLPGGYAQTFPTQNYGQRVPLSAGQNATGRHFADRPITPAGNTAAISGFAFNDTNKNGKQDSGETFAAGKTIWLDLDDDGVKDAGEKSVVTDAAGRFAFTGLAARTYHVRRQFPAGYAESTPPRYITVGTGQTFGNVSIGSKTK